MIPPYTQANFQVIYKAANAGRLSLMEYRQKANGQPVYAVCAVNSKEGGTFELIPLAAMIDGNPYELLDPPTPEGEVTAPPPFSIPPLPPLTGTNG